MNAHDRLNDWQPLFASALAILDAATLANGPFKWSFGGGTALMLSLRHRYSKDIDIFVPDPQFIGYLTPRLSPAAEAVTGQYDEGREFVKLRLPNGEIDFVGTGWLTPEPYRAQDIRGRIVNVETAAEIIGKKVRYRADTFKARDIYDFAMVSLGYPSEIESIRPILRDYREALEARVKRSRRALEEEFDELEIFDRSKSLDDCIRILRQEIS